MPGPDPTVRGQELGERLRLLREQAGLSLRDAARRIDVSPTKLSRLETGHRTAAPEDATALLAVYGVTGATRREVLALAREADKHGWWQRDRPDFPERQRTLISLEAKADHIVNYAGVIVPGLLQTGEYMRAVMEDSMMLPAEVIEQRMATRMHRHSAVLRGYACDLLVLMDELVLHRRVGGVGVLRRQLEQLVYWAEQPNITIRVLRNDGHHLAGAGAFQLIRQRCDGPTVVFLENLTSSLFVEDRKEISFYRNVVRNLLSLAVDEPGSVHLIEESASRLESEGEP